MVLLCQEGFDLKLVLKLNVKVLSPFSKLNGNINTFALLKCFV